MSFRVAPADRQSQVSTDLENTGSVWRSPCVEKVVFSSADEPFSTVGELERQNTALVQVELILVRFRVV